MENIHKSTMPGYLCLLLALAILITNILSAYIRHTEAGLVCSPGQDCYGVIGHLETPTTSEQITQAALQPVDFAKKLHRSIATGLVLLAFAVVYQARKFTPGQSIPVACYVLIGLILALAIIGPMSYNKTLPLIATSNLTGGLALLATAWWLWFDMANRSVHPVTGGLRIATNVCLAAMAVQIFLGAWTSANFAGTVCVNSLVCLPSVSDQPLSDQPLWQSFWLFRELDLDSGGNLMFSAAQVHISNGHRLFAVIASMTIVTLGIMALLRGFKHSIPILVLLVIQFTLGLVSQTFGLSLWGVIAHNLCAAMLLIAVLDFYRSTYPEPIAGTDT